MADQVNNPDPGTQDERPAEEKLFDLLNSDENAADQEGDERKKKEPEQEQEKDQDDAQDQEDEQEQSEHEEEDDQDQDDKQEEDDQDGDEDDADDDDNFEFEIDGEKLTPKQLREGHLRHKDYTQKTQAVAEDRKALEAEQAQLAQQRQAVSQLLQQQLVAEQQNLAQFKDIDWETLKTEDPEQYLVKKEELRDAAGVFQNRLAQIQTLNAQAQQDQQDAMAKFVKEEDVKLVGQIDGWDNAEKKAAKQKVLFDYATEQGFQGPDLNAFADSRAMVILDKARQFDEMQKAGKTVVEKKKAKAVKRVIKSGKPQPHKKTVAAEKVKAKKDKLRNSGSVDDAADLMSDWFL